MTLTSAGLTIKRLSDIVEDLGQGVIGEFGASTNTESDSVFGQLIGVFANELELVYELAQQLYDSFDPDQAEGASLDNICALLGIERKPATASTVSVLMSGVAPTLVPAATIFATDDDTATQFQTTASAVLDVTNFSPLGEVTFINAVTQTIGRDVGTWADDFVFVGLRITFIGSPLNSGTYEVIDIPAPQIITIADAGIVGETVPAGVTASAVLTSVDCQAVDTGALPAVAGSITTIVNPISGLERVYNYTDASVGSGIETDAELRIRRANSLLIVAAGVDWAIRSKLLQIPDVDYALVLSNRSDVTSPDGIPPHAFETVVYPNLSTDSYRLSIAQTIFYLQPAGIQAFGRPAPNGVTMDVLDGQGVTQQVQYTFAAELEMYVLAVVSIDPSSVSSYPADGDSQVAVALVAEGQALGVGDDVLNWKFVSSLDTIPGILDVDIYIREGSAPPYPAVDPALQANISISYKEIAKFDSSRVVVEST